MDRKAFTLVELLVSIALTSIVVLFLYKALSNQEDLNHSLSTHQERLKKKSDLFHLIYSDLFQAQKIQIKPLFNKNYVVINLQTTNSLYTIPKPFVTYFVHENNKTLVRLESADPIKLPMESEKIPYIFSLPLVSGVKKLLVQEVGGKNVKELLPGEKQRVEKNETKEYLLYLEWQEKKLVVDVKKE